MLAPYHKLDRLTLIIDNANQQLEDYTAKILDINLLGDKFRAFNWNVIEIDGHDYTQIIPALEQARNNSSDHPTCIVANTIKGKGVSFMERQVKWHGVAPKPEEVAAAGEEPTAVTTY